MIAFNAFRLVGSWQDTAAPAGVGVILWDHELRLILQLRDDWPGLRGGGQWAPFGGTQEAGEALDQTACREIAEETGLRLSPDDILPFSRFISPRPTPCPAFLFLAKRPQALHDIQLREGAGFGALNAAQVSQFPVIPVYRGILISAFAEIRAITDGKI